LVVSLKGLGQGLKPTFFETVFQLFVPSAIPTSVAIRFLLRLSIDRRGNLHGFQGRQTGWDKQDQRSP